MNKVKRHVSLAMRSIENDIVLDAWRLRLKVSRSDAVKRTCRVMVAQLCAQQQRLLSAFAGSVSSMSDDELYMARKLSCLVINHSIATKNRSGMWTLMAIENMRTWN